MNGETIRHKMADLGVSAEFVRASDEYSTSVSHILLEPSGERTILMAPASTSRLTAKKMKEEFGQAIATRASMLTTEVSQVPLSGVEYLLDAALHARIPSLLDVDVTPSVATGPAQLGTLDELRRIVTKPSVLKLTASAAAELLALVSSAPLESTLENVAQQLADAFGVRLCVVTDGSRGSALALGRKFLPAAPASGSSSSSPASASSSSIIEAVRVPIYKGVTQKDATGAGDAFFGGVIASIHAWGFPTNADGLDRIGRVAAASGAACVEVIGALPVSGVSPARMAALCADAKTLRAAADALDAAKVAASTSVAVGASSAAGGAAAATESDIFDAWLGSLMKDADAVSDAASAYTLHIATATDGVNQLVAALRSCAVPAPKAAAGGAGGAAGAGAGAGAAPAAAAAAASSGAAGSAAPGSAASSGAAPAAGGSAAGSSSSSSSAAPSPPAPSSGAAASGGVVYTTGVGKAGAVAARFALSLRSVGIKSAFVHGSEWVHGDMGAAGSGDVLVAFSHSGKSVEVVDAAARLKAKGVRVFSVTGDPASPLAKAALAHFRAPATGELLDTVPTRSVVAQEAVANAALSALVAATGLTRAAFKANHPGGAIGGGAAPAGTSSAGGAGAGAGGKGV
jgi:D-arabinose 5-phosphate isomerase GutQ/sugar/nucleoside kinase (ribokinase family)